MSETLSVQIIADTESANQAVDFFTDRVRRLREQLQTGQLSIKQYADGMARLKAEAAQLAPQVARSAEATARLAEQAVLVSGAMGSADTAARRMHSAMARTAIGVDVLTASVSAGRLSIGGLSAAMLSMATPGGALSMAIVGITAGAAVLDLLARRADRAADSLHAGLSEARALGAGLGARIRELEGQWTTDAQGRRLFVRGTPTDPEELTRLRTFQSIIANDEARNAKPERAGRVGAAGRRGRGEAEFALNVREPDPFAIQAARMRAEAEAFAPVAQGMADEATRLAAAMTPAVGAFDAIGDSIERANQRGELFGRIGANALDIVIRTAAAGGNVIQGFFRGAAQAMAQEAKAKSLMEVAEGFAALFNPFKGGPGVAGAHFRAAALYGTAAMAFGALGGGGGGGGGGGAGVASAQAPATSGAARPIQIIQIVGQDGRVLSQQVVQDAARYTARGGSVPGMSSQVTRVPVGNAVVVGRGFR